MQRRIPKTLRCDKGGCNFCECVVLRFSVFSQMEKPRFFWWHLYWSPPWALPVPLPNWEHRCTSKRIKMGKLYKYTLHGRIGMTKYSSLQFAKRRGCSRTHKLAMRVNSKNWLWKRSGTLNRTMDPFDVNDRLLSRQYLRIVIKALLISFWMMFVLMFFFWRYRLVCHSICTNTCCCLSFTIFIPQSAPWISVCIERWNIKNWSHLLVKLGSTIQLPSVYVNTSKPIDRF